jgi:hypothetical protein
MTRHTAVTKPPTTEKQPNQATWGALSPTNSSWPTQSKWVLQILLFLRMA